MRTLLLAVLSARRLRRRCAAGRHGHGPEPGRRGPARRGRRDPVGRPRRRAAPASSPDAVRAVDPAGRRGWRRSRSTSTGDGTPEHLLVLTHLWPGETQTFRVEAAAPAAPVRAARPRDARRLPRRHGVGERPHRVADVRQGSLGGRRVRAARLVGRRRLAQADARPRHRGVVREGPRRLPRRHRRRRRLLLGRHDARALAGRASGGTASCYRRRELRRLADPRGRTDPGRLRDGLRPVRRGRQVEVAETKRITIDAGRHLFRQESTYSAAGESRPSSGWSTGPRASSRRRGTATTGRGSRCGGRSSARTAATGTSARPCWSRPTPSTRSAAKAATTSRS